MKPLNRPRIGWIQIVSIFTLLAGLFLSAPSFALKIGDRVQANGNVNVRNTAAGSLIGTQQSGSLGYIIYGPQTASLSGTPYTWWQVHWDSSLTGWVADIGLTAVATQPGSFTLSNDAPVWDTNPPAAPAVNLRWSSSSNATGYEVYRNGVKIYPSSGTYAGTTFYNSAGLSSGQYYSYYIVARNSAGSTQSNTINVGPMPSAPQPVVVTPTAPTPQSPAANQVVSSLSQTLTWSGGSNFNSIQINLSKSPFGAANLVYSSPWLSASTSSTTVILEAGTSYRWDVTACSGSNGGGTCVTSNDAYFSTQAAQRSAPPTISSISPNPVTGSANQQAITIYGTGFINKPAITLSWTGMPAYTVPAAQVTYVSGTQLQMAITTTTLADNWTVKITNLDGQSSNTAGFQVVAPTPIATKPGTFNLSASTPYCSTLFSPPIPAVQINWSVSTGATSYEVYRNGVLYVNKPSNITTFTNAANDVVAGQTYTYMVVARNASGSTNSNTVTVNIPSAVCQSSTPTPDVKATITSVAGGPPNAPTLTVKVEPITSDIDMQVFVLAELINPNTTKSNVANSHTFYSLRQPSSPPQSPWVEWRSGPLLAYATKIRSALEFPVLDGSYDLSRSPGTRIFIGYGTSESDMLTNKRYQVVYTVQDTTQTNNILRLKWPLSTPRSNSRVSLEFGDPSPITCESDGAPKRHNGVDYTATAGTAVYPVADGVLKNVFDDSSDGWASRIVIEHPTPAGPYTTVYWHVDPTSEIAKAPPDSPVYKKNQIATVADLTRYLPNYKHDTHFHFGIRKGKYQDSSGYGALPYAEHPCDGRPVFPDNFINPADTTQVIFQ